MGFRVERIVNPLRGGMPFRPTSTRPFAPPPPLSSDVATVLPPAEPESSEDGESGSVTDTITLAESEPPAPIQLIV